jgi:hypothetical protein
MSDSPNQPAPGQPESELWILLTEDTGGKWRIDRLRKVARAVAAAWPSTAAKLSRLHDHEGHLSIVWNATPDEHDMHIVPVMWMAEGEPAENVEHFTPKWFRGAGAEKDAPL